MGMQLIETIEVGAGGAASIEFTSIPQDGVDLVLLTSLRTSSSFGQADIQFNGVGSGYSYRYLRGDGSTVDSNSGAGTSFSFEGASDSTQTANTFSSSSIYISNYTGSTSKSISSDSVEENNATSAHQDIRAGLSTITSGITSLLISKALETGSTASLYKITAD